MFLWQHITGRPRAVVVCPDWLSRPHPGTEEQRGSMFFHNPSDRQSLFFKSSVQLQRRARVLLNQPKKMNNACGLHVDILVLYRFNCRSRATCVMCVLTSCCLLPLQVLRPFAYICAECTYICSIYIWIYCMRVCVYILYVCMCSIYVNLKFVKKFPKKLWCYQLSLRTF